MGMIFTPMQLNQTSEIFSNWSKRELEALKQATENLKKQQPKPPKNKRVKTGVVGCHYHKGQACFIINAIINGKKVYAGRMNTFDKEKAVQMQQAAIEKHNEKNK